MRLSSFTLFSVWREGPHTIATIGAILVSNSKEVTMTYEHLLVEVTDGVAILTLNRPESLNAMNRKLSRELHQAVKAMEADDAVGCIVITGAGEKAFSA